MEEREMCFSWSVKSPKKEVHEQQFPTPSIWEDDYFRAFFDLTDEENPPPLHQSDYGHFHDVDVMQNKKVCLNLNLNYEEVLEAWSDRGSLWAAASSSHSNHSTHAPYMGEVPIIRMEEERRRRVKRYEERRRRVKRYKEKRHTRLFSKKIRYQVRKLNADKRPRIKGRFVKTDC